MFARVKKTGPYEYLQIVENRREDKKSRQRVIATVGRLDELRAKGQIETLTRSLSRFSERVLLLLSGRNENISAEAKKIGPALIFERLWKEVGMDSNPSPSSPGEEVRLRCGKGDFPDGPAPALPLRFRPVLRQMASGLRHSGRE